MQAYQRRLLSRINFCSLTKLIYAIGIALALSGCSKDPYIYSSEHICEEYRQAKNVNLGQIKSKGVSRWSGCYNASNLNEAFYITDAGQGYEIVAKNLINGQTKTVHSETYRINGLVCNSAGSLAYVDSRNWIYILLPGEKTSKIISPEGVSNYPVWESDTTLLFQYSHNGGNPKKYLRVNLLGDILDTLDNVKSYRGDLQHDGKLVSLPYSGHASLNIYALKDEGRLLKVPFEEKVDGLNSIEALHWGANDNQAYYSNFGYGLFSVNFGNGKSTQILDGCPLKRYTSIDLSFDKSQLLLTREDLEAPYGLDGGTLYSSSNVYTFDLNSRALTAL